MRRFENRSTRRKTSRSKDENQLQTQPTCDAESGNRTRATMVGSECSHHCAIPAPLEAGTSSHNTVFLFRNSQKCLIRPQLLSLHYTTLFFVDLPSEHRISLEPITTCHSRRCGAKECRIAAGELSFCTELCYSCTLHPVKCGHPPGA